MKNSPEDQGDYGAQPQKAESAEEGGSIGLIGRMFAGIARYFKTNNHRGELANVEQESGQEGWQSENIGVVDPTDEVAKREMLSNVLSLRHRSLRDFAVPRAEIIAIDAKATYDEMMAAFARGYNSRLPVYRGTLDNPIGFVHLKDIVLKRASQQSKERSFNLEKLVRKSLVAPPSMPPSLLLARMQAERIHLALIIDEYGGVDGLVTIEDLVEQIVGDIEDEHDSDSGPSWVKESKDMYLCDARVQIDDFVENTGVNLLSDDTDENIHSLGGLAFTAAGRVPELGEIIVLNDTIELEIVEADARQIERLRVRTRSARKETRTDS